MITIIVISITIIVIVITIIVIVATIIVTIINNTFWHIHIHLQIYLWML